MPMRISRAAYADMFGPTTGDKVRLADTDLVVEVEKDFTTYGEEVKFGGGKVIRDGMGQSQASRAEGAVDTVITNALIIDHTGIVKADVGLRDGRIAAIGKAGNPDVQPGVDIIVGPGTEVDRRRGQDPHRRRHRQPHPLHLPAADRGGAELRHHHDGRRRHRPRHRHGGHHLHARPLASRAHDRGGRRVPDEPRLRRQGQRLAARGAGGDDPGRRLLPEAARGLGHDAGRHRLRAVRGRRPRRAGDDPHRHAERVGLRRGHHRRLQGPHHPCLPHRGRRRRARARHHQGGGPQQRAAVLHQPDAALHGEHAGRASRHADGVPPPRRQHPRGHRLRREPHPPRDDRRRGHPARPRRALDDLLRQPGHGPRRRGDHPHLADGAQDEGAARPAEGGQRRATTTSASSATSPSTPSTRPSRRAWRTSWARWRWASAPISCCGARRSSA